MLVLPKKLCEAIFYFNSFLHFLYFFSEGIKIIFCSTNGMYKILVSGFDSRIQSFFFMKKIERTQVTKSFKTRYCPWRSLNYTFLPINLFWRFFLRKNERVARVLLWYTHMLSLLPNYIQSSKIGKVSFRNCYWK